MNRMKRIFLIMTTVAVLLVSIHTILKPSMISEPPTGEVVSITPAVTSAFPNPLIEVHSKTTPNVIQLSEIRDESIEVKYNNKTFTINPMSDEGRRLLYSAQQVLLTLTLNTFITSKKEVEINALKEKSSYIEIKLKSSHDLPFGNYNYSLPVVRLIFIMEGENAGLVASLPSEGAELWSCKKAEQDSPEFLRLMDALMDSWTQLKNKQHA